MWNEKKINIMNNKICKNDKISNVINNIDYFNSLNNIFLFHIVKVK